MLAVSGLSVAIARTPILHDIGLTVAAGETAGLIGRNGAGKTTLMRAVMGLQPAIAGDIALDDVALAPLPAHRRAGLGIGYMPEDRRLVPGFTVAENVRLPLWATGAADVEKRIAWVTSLVPEIAELAGRRALSLSGGQQKLVALARALACGRRLLLLDEPFEGVAPALARRLAEVIAALGGAGIAVVLSESDYTHSVALLDRLFVIERGVVEERDPRVIET